jgi:hypothetical protein
LEEANTLWNLLNAFQPKHIMDAGIGFSTYVILKYLFLNYKQVERVTLVDNSISIADKILRFCYNNKQDVNDDKIYFRRIEHFYPSPARKVDFLNYDFKIGSLRLDAFKSFYETVLPGGTIFVSDMQDDIYRAHIEQIAYSTDASYTSYKEVLQDKSGRYSSVILKR